MIQINILQNLKIIYFLPTGMRATLQWEFHSGDMMQIELLKPTTLRTQVCTKVQWTTVLVKILAKNLHVTPQFRISKLQFHDSHRKGQAEEALRTGMAFSLL